MNHTERGVTAVYDCHSYNGEKRAALDAWGTHLQEIAGTSARADNIVTLPTRAAV